MSKNNNKNEKKVVLDIPRRLSVDPFFIDILSLTKEDLFQFNLKCLQSFGYTDIKSFEHPEQGYIFAKGTLPVCLCAHMDKVPRYKKIKHIARTPMVNKLGEVVDIRLSSKQGIGGDDRCGVYAILEMLKLGHRPSVLFCMGEEIGCRGSRKFTMDYTKDVLADINAFIQIDRRGSNDCVRYSDNNTELTDVLAQFGYKHAWGSCSDISVLMPHFGISGVNLSSGYYHEHMGSFEYVSIHDVKTLLKRLNKILSSDIFEKKYEYKSFYSSHSVDELSSYHRGWSRFDDDSDYEQLSLLPNYPYIDNKDIKKCDYCGELFSKRDLVEVDSARFSFVCSDCAEKAFLKQGYVRCPSCKNLFMKETTSHDPNFVRDFCPFCGSEYDE